MVEATGDPSTKHLDVSTDSVHVGRPGRLGVSPLLPLSTRSLAWSLAAPADNSGCGSRLQLCGGLVGLCAAAGRPVATVWPELGRPALTAEETVRRECRLCTRCGLLEGALQEASHRSSPLTICAVLCWQQEAGVRCLVVGVLVLWVAALSLGTAMAVPRAPGSSDGAEGPPPPSDPRSCPAHSAFSAADGQCMCGPAAASSSSCTGIRLLARHTVASSNRHELAPLTAASGGCRFAGATTSSSATAATMSTRTMRDT